MNLEATTVPKADHKTMLTIFRLISGSRVDPNKVVAGSLRIDEAGDTGLVVEIDHIVYDVNGDPVRKLEENGRVGLATRTRTFHLPTGYETTEKEDQREYEVGS